MSYLLAHFSDPHLTMETKPKIRELASKRVTGYLNYRRNRSKAMGGDVLGALIADMKRQEPDHIALTGDLVNIALDEEIDAAGSWLRTVGEPDAMSLVPGNHDAYVTGALQRAHGTWGAYWQDDDRADSGLARAFPYVRQRGPLALIGLSTAIHTRPFMATGELGRSQIDRFQEILKSLPAHMIKVVMIHHPPFIEKKRHHKRLIDLDAFNRTIREFGADLILHGHTHRRNITKLPTPTGQATVIGVPSASSGFSGKHEPARYNLYRFSKRGETLTCTMEERGINENGAFETCAEHDFIIRQR